MRHNHQPYPNIIKAVVLLFLMSTPFLSFSQNGSTTKKTGMLILGSDNIETLKARVNVGYKLYNSSVDFDYIIVSGGCGAHKSTICEASEMAALLIENGVPASKIFKEEKSKNTVQNYVYSRSLKMPDGSKVINKGDSLFVVSNHWHAMSVAARFSTYDQVKAVYHIEGSIIPSTTDKVDYVNIFHGNSDNEDFLRKALSPLVDVSYSLEGRNFKENKIYNFIGGKVYLGSAGDISKVSQKEIAEAIIGLPVDWQTDIDAAFYNPAENKVYLFKGDSYLKLSPDAKTVDKGYPKLIRSWISNLPGAWQHGYIGAALFNNFKGEVTLFKGEEYLTVSVKARKIKEGPKKITTFVTNWPFGWGSGDIDAANFNTQEGMIYLYRGKEYLKIPYDGKASVGEVEPGYPQTIKLK